MLIKYTAYTGVIISVCMTVSIFASFADSVVSCVLMVGIAFVIEVSRFTAWINRHSNEHNIVLFGVLFALSISASIGTLSATAGTAVSNNSRILSKVETLQKQQVLLQQSADKLIALERVTKAQPLLVKVALLSNAIDSELLKLETNSVIALAETFSQLTTASPQVVLSGLYVFLAVILDVCCMFLLEILKVEKQQRKKKQQQQYNQHQFETHRSSCNGGEAVIIDNSHDVQHFVNRILSGHVTASIRGIKSGCGVGYPKARLILDLMIDKDLLIQDGASTYRVKPEHQLALEY